MDVEQILIDNINKIAEENHSDENNYKIKSIDTGGANFSSALYQVTIPTPDGELNLFAKIASMSNEMRIQNPILTDHMYRTEAFFYKTVAKYFDEIQNNFDITDERFRYPKVYCYNLDYMKETIVMEDLTLQGFFCHDRMEPVTWQYASCAMEQLAKINALSYALEKKYPNEYRNIKNNHTRDQHEFISFYRKIMLRTIKIVKSEFRDSLSKLTECLEDMFDAWFEKDRRMMITHGDYRPSNMLHRFTEGNIEIIPIDYQGMHVGCPIMDILYFVSLSTDKTFRDNYFEDLMNHYYNYLDKFLKLLNLNIDIVYPRKDFDEDLKELLPYVIVTAIAVLPTVLVDEADAREFLSNPHRTWDFPDNFNELFLERLNDLLDDCRKWGIL